MNGTPGNTAAGRTRVLFVCIGNSCRSQMAEGFANRYGSDVLEAFSAGVYPAELIAPLTRKVMLAKNIDLAGAMPKDIDDVPIETINLVVNMSGHPFPVQEGVSVEEWKVHDPVGDEEDVFITVAEEIEQRVMRLILLLRKQQASAQ